MQAHRIYTMSFDQIYPLYIAKVEKKEKLLTNKIN